MPPAAACMGKNGVYAAACGHAALRKTIDRISATGNPFPLPLPLGEVAEQSEDGEGKR